MRFSQAGCSSANPALCQLADGTVVATCWHISIGGGETYPIPFATSATDGASFEFAPPASSTGIIGQAHGTTGAHRVVGGGGGGSGGPPSLYMAYNKRQQTDQPGVRLAVAAPHGLEFRLLADQLVWAGKATQSDTSGSIDEWTDFAFGEPSVLEVDCGGGGSDDLGALMVLFWCVEQDEHGAVTRSAVGFAHLRPRREGGSGGCRL